jgi:N-acyl-D-aspartate/D-glutamate deacylase
MQDLVIRGATVVDGLGHDPIRADVAVKAGRIAAIGEVGNDASEIVDAGGLALMPGIITMRRSPGTRLFRHRLRSGSRPRSWAIAVSVSCRRRLICGT